MIFKFQQAYTSRSESFEMDIPVNFVIPDKFNSLEDLGVLGSHNQEVCDLLTSLGVHTDDRYSFRVSKYIVIVNLRAVEFTRIKTILLRDQKLKKLLNEY